MGLFVHSRSRSFKGSLDVRRDFSGLFLIHYTLFLHELKPQTALQMAYRINRHCRKSILYLLTQLMPDMLKLEEMGSNE